jgi:hypothetical protein
MTRAQNEKDRGRCKRLLVNANKVECKVRASFAMYYREPRTLTGDKQRLTNVATGLS